jgi:hypothetical protein
MLTDQLLLFYVLFCMGMLFEIYTLLLYIVNFVKKKNMSGMYIVSGVFFLGAIFLLLLHNRILWTMFFIWLFVILVTRLILFRIERYFAKMNRLKENSLIFNRHHKK